MVRALVAATLLALAAAPSAQTLERATTDRPDDTTAPQIHLMYVVPSDGADRGFDVNGTIVNSTVSWERWLAGQTGGLELRLDTFMGQPDVTFVRLPESDAQIAARVQYVRDEVQLQLHALGFVAPRKIYAVFYDGTSTFSCGGGAWPPVLPGDVAALYLKGAGCPDVYAGPGQTPGYRDFSMVHEIMHTLGFVPTCAPHHTLAGHVSDSIHDLMWAGPTPPYWDPTTLDVGHDDYYGAHISGCLDFADSTYLNAVQRLTVNPTGDGRVTSTPPGIDCPRTCSASFDRGTALTLTATPLAGSSFDGWSGACAGTGPCSITLASDATVGATFSRRFMLTVTTTGGGRVASNVGGIACPSVCVASLREGTTVTLTATALADHRFDGWSGACSGKAVCTLTLTADTSVGASFSSAPKPPPKPKPKPKKRKRR